MDYENIKKLMEEHLEQLEYSESSFIEENFDKLILDDDDYFCPDEEFSFEEDNHHPKCDDNPYLKSLFDSADLKILQPALVSRSYKQQKELGLFSLFLTPSLVETIRTWTEKRMIQKGYGSLSLDLLHAYFGVEIAMSLMHCNNIYDYWSSKKFLGSKDISEVMTRKTFTQIRSCLQFYPEYDHELAENDPLWHSRFLIENFLKSSSKIAVPDGPSAIDENTIRCKARTGAKTYIRNKPVKFGIRFYAVVGWKFNYLYNIWDNGSGNKTNINPASKYCQVFRDLRNSYTRHIVNDGEKIIDHDTSTALWSLQIAQMYKMLQSPCGKRVIFMDNYYTRHPLGRKIKQLTNNETKIIGTVKMNLVDKYNKPKVLEAIEMLQDANHGTWYLVPCFDPPKSTKSSSKKKKNNTKKLKTANKSDAEGPLVAAENTGYIVFKDKRVVVFYSNDLADTPPPVICGAENADAVRCVHGLSSLERWTGNEIYHKTKLLVPAVIVAYNIFMNSVDRFDQYRQTNITQRREKRVPMSIFTFILDACINNAYAIYQKINKTTTIDMKEFKRRIAEQLVANTKIRVAHVQGHKFDDDTYIPMEHHTILETQNKKRNICYLCRLVQPIGATSKPASTPYFCLQCRKGFCVNCLTAYHHFKEFSSFQPDTAAKISNAKKNKILSNQLRHKPINSGTEFATMKFSFDN